MFLGSVNAGGKKIKQHFKPVKIIILSTILDFGLLIGKSPGQATPLMINLFMLFLWIHSTCWKVSVSGLFGEKRKNVA